MKIRILLIEDEESYYLTVKSLFAGTDVEIVWADTGQKGIQLFRQNPNGFAVVVIDYKLPDLKGTEVCQTLRKINADQEFLFASGYKDLNYWEDLLETGSSGFIFKGNSSEIMKAKINTCVGKYKERHRLIGNDDYEESKTELQLKAVGITGRTAVMHEVLEEIEPAKESPFPVLILGETGVGKELIARALTPKGKTLIAVNCASFLHNEQLMESQLFGHVKGAFTGADRESTGLVLQAHNNVLFLDELHQLSISAQAKLLRFLQEMRFRRLGDSSGNEISVKFKLIAAAQPDIRERIKDGRFLPDLVERVGALMIRVPPLRERPEDIELLVRKFQDEFNKGKEPTERRQVRISTVAEMMKYNWPTNVRGLQNAVRFMLTRCKNGIAEPTDFRVYLEIAVTNESHHAPPTAEVHSLEDATSDFERRHLEEALKLSWTRKEAASRVGMAFTTFVRRLSKLGINPEMFLRHNADTRPT